MNDFLQTPFNAMVDGAQMWTRMWMDMATRIAQSNTGYEPDASPPEAARQARSSLFQAMSQHFEQMMRSPQMLEMMKQSMDMMFSSRKQYNDMLSRIRQEMQGTSRRDIDNLMLSVRHMETRVLDRLEEVSFQLEEITRRLDNLEGGHNDNGSESGPARRRPSRQRSDKE
jgi:hypothetical protein